MTKIKDKLRGLSLKGLVVLTGFIPLQSAFATEVIQENSVKSKYVGLGLEFGKNPVFQNATTLEEGNLSATFYANSDLKEGKCNELDAMVGLTIPISDKVEASIGYSAYNLPGEEVNGRRDWSALHEAKGSINFNTLLNPSLSGCHIFDKGTYLQAGISHDFPVNLPLIGKTDLSASIALALNDYAFREKSGFSHIGSNASLPIDLGKGITIEPMISYSVPLASDIDNQFYVGATTSTGFSF